MSSKPEAKYLTLRADGSYLFKRRVPPDLRKHPIFLNREWYSKNLGHVSLTKARLARDAILLQFRQMNLDDTHATYVTQITQELQQFIAGNTHMPEHEAWELFRSMEADKITDRAIADYGHTPKGHPVQLSDNQQAQLDVLAGRESKQKMGLKHTSEQLIASRKKVGGKGASESALNKMSEAVTWFLASIKKKDIQLVDITYTMVSQALENSGRKGNTKMGYSYGLAQCWKYAKKRSIGPREMISPFEGHEISKDDADNNDLYTKAELYQLYLASTGELRQLIHMGATTGARLEEILTAELHLKTLLYDKPAWYICFKTKGKNEAAKRIVPVHESIDIDSYAPFTVKRATLQSQFVRLRTSLLGKRIEPLTGKVRRLTFHSFRTSIETELRRRPGFDRMASDAMMGRKQTQASAGSAASYLQSPYELKAIAGIVELIEWKPTP
jgi:hypothetical protein